MQIRIFSVPVLGGSPCEQELNSFLRSKKIIDIERQLTTVGEMGYWSFCVRYIENAAGAAYSKTTKQDKPDYKNELDEDSFKRFSHFREIRKKLAREEAVPAYAIFTDFELAEIARLATPSLSALQKIKGIGLKKVEKYGKHFVTRPKPEQENETSSLPD